MPKRKSKNFSSDSNVQNGCVNKSQPIKKDVHCEINPLHDPVKS